MHELKKYSIPFEGLKQGEHEFEYLVDHKFFEAFKNPEFEDGKVKVKVLLNKQESMLLLHFDIQGYININCDRCWEEMEYPIESNDKLIVKFGNEGEKTGDEIIFLSDTEFEINIAQPVYDFINLALPVRRVHKEGDCNKAAIEKLEALKLKSKNQEQTDPRWDKLAQLKEDNKK